MEKKQKQTEKKYKGKSEKLSFQEEIEKQLLEVMDSDPEFGRKKVNLFAARNGFRVFPFYLSSLDESKTFKEGPGKVERLGRTWRALIFAWEGGIRGNAKAVAMSAVRVAASGAANAAYANYGDINAKVVGAAVNAAYASNEDLFSTNSIGNAAAYAKFDLDLFKNPRFSVQEIYQLPLWPNNNPPQHILDFNWQSFLSEWIKNHSNKENEQEIKFLSQILQDYDAIFNGTWDGGEIESTIREIADNKNQQDFPASIDCLDRDQLVNALIPRLSQKNDKDHLTIGLLGDWGIGKSSVIEQLRVKLDAVEHKEYFFAEFNAWKYEHTANLQAGIAHELISVLTALPAQKQWPWYKQVWHKFYVKWKFAVKLHGKRILAILLISLSTPIVIYIMTLKDSIGSQLPIAGAGILAAGYVVFKQLRTVISEPFAKELKTYIQLPSYQKHLGTIPEMSKHIKALCEICLGKKGKEIERELVFFVDDLDRCGVEGIVKTFEAVRLVLDIPWVTVIIAMDQRIALPALACHYEKLSKYHQRDPMSIARDYLAKVIHLPIRLSAPDDLSVARYLANIWDDAEFVNKIKQELEPQPSVSEQTEDTEGVDVEEGVNEEGGEEKPRESFQDILDDINRIDIQAVFKANRGDKNPEGGNVKEVSGFGELQKIQFYHNLISFNLRNPRQIKRLYNSYNLLWGIYDSEWQKDSSAWTAHMLGLIILEMINEHVPFNDKVDTREHYRQALFSLTGDKKVASVKGVKSEDINKAYQIIKTFQEQKKINLLTRLEPFVLPAIALN